MHVYLGEKPKEEKEKRKEDELAAVARDIFGRQDFITYVDLAEQCRPPSFANSYEWLTGAALPTEFETEVQMGHLELLNIFQRQGKRETTSSHPGQNNE